MPAKRGYAKAQYSLGERYRYGAGTAINKAAPIYGSTWPRHKARDGLVWQLKPEQIVEMQEEARLMTRATHPPTAVPKPTPATP